MEAITQQVQALWRGCGALLRPDVRTLRLSGPDRVRFLNGMVTHDVAKLACGEGLMAIKTSNKGRIEALMRVRARAEAFDLDVSATVAAALLASLDQYIIMDDCKIEDISHTREVVSILGPGAGQSLDAPLLSPHAFVDRGRETLIADAMLLLPGFELHVQVGEGKAVLERVKARGATEVTGEALDIARIEAGAPIDGRDLDLETLPMEARLTRALSFDKGCYVGQEVIARATNLGGIKYILVGLGFAAGDRPQEGASIVSDGRVVGEVASVADSVMLGHPIALAYLRRTHEAIGTKVQVIDGENERKLECHVLELPFIR